MDKPKPNPYGCEESDKILEVFDRQTGRNGVVRIPITTYVREVVTNRKDILNMLIEEMYCRIHNIPRPNNMDTWTMRDGKTILIKDMSDSHLINCIKMMKRSI